MKQKLELMKLQKHRKKIEEMKVSTQPVRFEEKAALQNHSKEIEPKNSESLRNRKHLVSSSRKFSF